MVHGQRRPFLHSPWRQGNEQFDLPNDPRATRLPPTSGSLQPGGFYDTWSTLWRPFIGSVGNHMPAFEYLPNTILNHYDPARNEYFRLQKRQRLANLTTQRSSVFAIWITIGYFELEEVAIPIPDDPNVPLQEVTFELGFVESRTAIGREYGIYRGEQRRDRAFYIIDRSIPVGFIPGENLNVDQAVLLRRYPQ